MVFAADLCLCQLLDRIDRVHGRGSGRGCNRRLIRRVRRRLLLQVCRANVAEDAAVLQIRIRVYFGCQRLVRWLLIERWKNLRQNCFFSRQRFLFCLLEYILVCLEVSLLLGQDRSYVHLKSLICNAF